MCLLVIENNLFKMPPALRICKGPIVKNKKAKHKLQNNNQPNPDNKRHQKPH